MDRNHFVAVQSIFDRLESGDTPQIAAQGRLPLLHFPDWKFGYQAQILRDFCEANHLPSIRFHTIRACFATK